MAAGIVVTTPPFVFVIVFTMKANALKCKNIWMIMVHHDCLALINQITFQIKTELRAVKGKLHQEFNSYSTQKKNKTTVLSTKK